MTELRRCIADHCVFATREGKPYCPDHVEEHWYVQGILKKIANMNRAEERIAEFGIRVVDPRGALAGEILDRLGAEPHWGYASVARLIREVRRQPAVVHKILYVLAKHGRVRLDRNNRGGRTVEIVEINRGFGAGASNQ